MKVRAPFLNLFSKESMAAEFTNKDYYFFNEINFYSMASQFTSNGAENFLSTNTVDAFIALNTANKRSGYREVAIVGRSNVGKSSLINSLLGQKLAVTSKTPGRTQQIITFPLNLQQVDACLIDCPGYGFAKAPKKEMENWGKLMTSYMNKSKNLLRVICLVDADHGIKAKDIELFEFLSSLKKVFNVTLMQVVLTKSDKRLPPLESFKYLPEKYPYFANFIFATSTRTGYGINELRAYLNYLYLTEDIYKL
mmetsp:Transcript_5900/g.10502  ORF Transcript_5900/g.10502 Transcript_5900/m.10502 type:complete len:252 (+) Transcript_5900:675-1430(+)